MKKIITLVFLIVFGLKTSAQECRNYYYLSENSQVQMTIYDKKGKDNGKLIYKITEVKKDGDAFSSLLASTVLDEKGNTISSGEGKFKCNGATIDVDMKMSVNSEQMKAYKDMNVRAEDAYLSYPMNLEIGQSLPEGNFKMEVDNNGVPFSTLLYNIINRKVEAKESITTSAGTWDCFKIAYDGQMNVRTMGIGIPVSMKVLEWYAPGFGIVKTETYSKNDKLMGSTVLTSLSK